MIKNCKQLLLLLIFLALSGCSGEEGEASAPTDDLPTFSGTTSATGSVAATEGASLVLSNGAKLSIPPDALSADTTVSIEVVPNSSVSDSQTYILSPAGTTFNQPVTLEIPLTAGEDTNLVDIFLHSAASDPVDTGYGTTRFEPLEVSYHGDAAEVTINHFSAATKAKLDPLYVVFALPSNYLMPGDIEFSLNRFNMWATGHTRMHLGFTRDIISDCMDGYPPCNEGARTDFMSDDDKDNLLSLITVTNESDYPKDANNPVDQVIESSNWGWNVLDGVYISQEDWYRDKRDDLLYMGAKRRSDLTWDERIDIAKSAVDLEGAGYSDVFVTAPFFDTYTCTGLIETAYQSIDKGLTSHDLLTAGNPVPALLYKSSELSDINEITVYEGDHVAIPVYGVLRNDAVPSISIPPWSIMQTIPKTYSAISVTASGTGDVTNVWDNASLAQIINSGGNGFNWVAERKPDGSPWVITFTATGEYYSETYSKSRTLKINVLSHVTVPNPPTNVQAFAGDSEVTLTWDSVPNANGYAIYWSTTPGALQGGNIINVGNIATYLHADLANDSTYYYTVTAINNAGESEGSVPEVYATPSDQNIFIIDDFNDNDFTSDPTWTLQNNDDHPGSIDMTNGYVNFLRSGAAGNGGSVGIDIMVNIPVTDSTIVKFDALVNSRSVGDGCGWTCGEYPANVMLFIEDGNGIEYRVKYSVNYGNAVLDKTDMTFKQYAVSIQQGIWERGMQFRIRDAWPTAVRLTKVHLFGNGWDFDGGVDNLEIGDSSSGGTSPVFKTLSAGGLQYTCALDESDMVCWGGKNVIRELNNPVHLDAGNGECVLDDRGETCYDEVRSFLHNRPELSNTTYISGAPGLICAIDNGEEVCWGGGASDLENIPDLINPKVIEVGYSGADHLICALDDLGVRCWGGAVFLPAYNVPHLINPQQIAVGNAGVACAIDDSGAVCWGDNRSELLDMPDLSNPSMIKLGNEGACAIHDEGVSCWGHEVYAFREPPTLINPTEITVGDYHACARDDTGVVCWGGTYGEYNIVNDVPARLKNY